MLGVTCPRRPDLRVIWARDVDSGVSLYSTPFSCCLLVDYLRKIGVRLESGALAVERSAEALIVCLPQRMCVRISAVAAAYVGIHFCYLIDWRVYMIASCARHMFGNEGNI